MEYIYLGDNFTDPSLKGKGCNAVRRSNGKCIRSRMSTMLVSFNGITYNVLARRLRRTDKPKNK